MNKTPQKMYVGADALIFNMMTRNSAKVIDIAEIFNVCDFLENKVKKSSEIQFIVFDVNHQTIQKTVRIYSDVFDLIGSRVYLKKPCIPEELRQSYVGKCVLSGLIGEYIQTKRSGMKMLVE